MNNRSYGTPKTTEERLATHKAIYGNEELPPRGTGILETTGCSVCGNTINIPTGVTEFTCPYCGSVYEVTSPKLADNGWVLPFLGGFILSAIIFTSVGRSMVKTVGEASLTELQTAVARRKAKVTTPPGGGAVW